MVSRPDFADARRRAVLLSARTSLGVGGQPELWFEPNSVEEAAVIVAACRAAGVPLRHLGGGANLLVGDAPLSGADSL